MDRFFSPFYRDMFDYDPFDSYAQMPWMSSGMYRGAPALDWMGGGQSMVPSMGGMGGRRGGGMGMMGMMDMPLAQFTDRGMSQMVNDKHQFAVNLDVHQFKPEEITVKTSDDYVTIEGSHEEREDPHGYIKRHFVRKYMLPDDVKAENVSSTLSADGVLTVKAPKERRAIEGKQNEHEIPIERSPYPAVAIKARGGGEKQQQQQMMEQGQGKGQKEMKQGEKQVHVQREQEKMEK